MFVTREKQDRILLAIAIAAAALIQVSIAASQTLLGAGILLLLVFRQRLEFPRIWIPLALFFLWTALADVLSPDPWGGRAQIRKFFVFLFIPLIYSVFVRNFDKVYYLMVAWTITATASGVWGLIQFVTKYEQDRLAPEGFYIAYLRRRITGFESHWMTFGALQLSVFSLLLAQLFFSNRRMPAWTYSSLAVLSATILLGWTRSIWLAAIPSTLYLVWFWRPRMTLAIPVIAVLAFLLAPQATRDRMMSLIEPRADVDSNRHRMVTFRTGIEMIKVHPWFGLGPEQIRRSFDAYVPADIQRPLPVGYYGHLHNIYIQYAAERGIPALLLMMWLVGMAMWDCFQGVLRAGRARSQELFVLHGTIAVTIGILVGGLFEYNLGDSEVLMMFLSVIAMGYAAVRKVNVEPAPVHEAVPEPHA
jgi:putative inorganic carbon (HCO3(-)) transporter